MKTEVLQRALDDILRIDPNNLNYVYEVQKIVREAAIALPVQPDYKTIDSILDGIDRWSGDNGTGWWETSDEIAFGARKLAEIKAFFAASQALPKPPAGFIADVERSNKCQNLSTTPTTK